VLPTMQKLDYQRPPMQDQRFVPQLF
jgi:hypothetical protein